MKFCKKASLNLSINAIVILILAITMLGLGLAFMRNIFGSATQEFEEVGGTVKKQMIDQMKESTKIVDISRPKVELKGGEKTQIFLGFKNDGSSPVDFQIREVESSKLGAPGSRNLYNLNLAGTITPILGTDDRCGVKIGTIQTAGDAYIELKNTKTNVGAGDVVVIPMNIHALTNPDPGTCIYEIKVDTKVPTSADGTEAADEIIELTVDITT